MSNKKERQEWLDIAKWIGMFFVLANHIGFSMGPVSLLGGTFYMAVFFVVAGYTFFPKSEEGVGTFAWKKAKRLLLPYFAVNGVLFFLYFAKDLWARQVSGNTVVSLMGIFYARNRLWAGDHPGNLFFLTVNPPSWFLACLFLTLVVYKKISTENKQENHRAMWITTALFALSCGYHAYSPLLLPWSIDAIPLCLAFMGVGQYIRKIDLIRKLMDKPYWMVPLVLGFVLLSFLNGSGNMSIGDYGRFMVFYFINGLLGSVVCLLLSYVFYRKAGAIGRVLALLGRNTLPVLCLHLTVFSVVEKMVRLFSVDPALPAVKFIMILCAFTLALPGIWREKKNGEIIS